MTPRQRSSLLWGLVGALSFLVLAQGYRLATGEGLALTAMAAVAVAVWAVATVGSYALARRLAGNRHI
ncbi:MAG: hypothetical protein ABEJ76_09725 [Halanaeroarchaeum sp.]